MFAPPESLRDVPETDIHHLRPLLDEEEPVAELHHPPDLVLGQLHDSVHLQLKPGSSLASPGQPELEDVVVTTTLDHLVARVVAHVVVLVLLEQVARLHGVAVRQDALLLQVESGALEENTEELVRVPSEAVRSLHPREPADPVCGAHQQTSTPGSVNMKPEAELLTDISNGVDGVEGS